MRRGLAIVSVLSVMAGLELATGGLSLAVGRLLTGLGALMSGNEFHVGPARFVSGVVLFGLGLVLAGLLAWSTQMESMVTLVGRACPECGTATRRIKRKKWQRILTMLTGERLTRRRCETCYWTGLSLRQ